MDEKVYLDPLNDDITAHSFAPERQTMINHLERLRDHPYDAKVILSLCILFLVFMVYLQFLTTHVDFIITGLGFFPMIVYIGYIRNLQNELLMYLLSEKNKWVYNPVVDHGRGKRLARLFPEVFHRGDIQAVDNQIWGQIGRNNTINFWSCLFLYRKETDRAEVTRDSLLAQYLSTKYRQQAAYVIELDDILPVTFMLECQGNKGDITTESVEFNKKFRIRMAEKNKQEELLITQALSPSVQVRLIDFAKKVPIDCILFQQNCMVVLCKGKIWQSKYTNFFKSITIDDRDVKRFNDLIIEMTELPLEMRKYLR